MKKHYFAFLLFSAIFTSCQSNDFDEVSSYNEEVNARSISANPIDEIVGIPINLKIPGLYHDSKYLSARKTERKPCLYYKDDDSGRQKWVISKVNGKYMIKAVSGVKNNWLYLGLKAENTQGIWPRMQTCYTANNMLWNFEQDKNSNLYRISILGKDPKSEIYLSAKNENYISDIMLSRYANSNLQLWEISPIETFEIVSVRYSLSGSDFIKTKPSFLSYATVNNWTSVTQSTTASFQTRASETSSFSKTEGFSTTIAAGAKVGIPVVSGGSVNISTTTSQTWTYGITENQEDSRSYSFPVVVPPYTSVTAVSVVAMYDVSITYTMTLKGTISGRIITETGKWTGVKAGDVNYDILETKTKKLLKSIKGIPSSTIDLSN